MSKRSGKTWFHSMSSRLLGVFLIANVILGIAMAAVYDYVDRNFVQNIYLPQTVQYLKLLSENIGTPPDLNKLQHSADLAVSDLYLKTPSLQWSSSSAPLPLFDLETYKFSRQEFNQIEPLRYAFLDGFPILIWQQQDFTLYVTQKAGHDYFPGLKQTTLIAAVITLIIFILFYLFTRWLFAPIKQIHRGIKRFSKGQLNHRIHLAKKNELGDLADHFDTMADDIQGMLESKRQLLLAISHELRTPITRANISTAMLEDSELKEEITDDLKEMEKLVSWLMESERLNTRHRSLDLSHFSVNQLLTEATQYPQASSKDQSIQLQQLDQDIELKADEKRLQLLLKNLLSNALRHSTDPVQLSARIDDQQLVLTVKDFGEGIAPEHLEHLYEPFYRPDKSRQRASGGYGLGLYLCQLIAVAHLGHLTVDSELGRGTTVSVLLPLS